MLGAMWCHVMTLSVTRECKRLGPSTTFSYFDMVASMSWALCGAMS